MPIVVIGNQHELIFTGSTPDMCGICGFSGTPNNSILHKMADAIRHRGPDGEGFFSDGSMNMAMRRLSIVDIEGGRQPMHNEDSSIWVVFNGEIYDYQNHWQDLIKRGHIFSSDHSDTEILLHLYEEYGAYFPQKLNGMFAIAIWDKKRNTLLLVRDRMGVKPLFYTIIGDTIVFGSEIKTILLHPKYRKEVDFESLYHYFSLKNVPSPMTAFKGIRQLLPGEMLEFSNGNISTQRWWKIKYVENNNIDPREVEETILRLLDDSTRLRMYCDVPFGAYLSGGIDSCTIVALMSQYLNHPVKTFTLGYEDDIKNKAADIYFARKLSKLYNTEHFEYITNCKELTESIEDVISSFDQPYSGVISTFFLSKLISNHVKVALSGDGADELFGSYLSHRVARPISVMSQLYEKIQSSNATAEDIDLLYPCDPKMIIDLYERSEGDEPRWRAFLSLCSDNEKQNILSPSFISETSAASTLKLFRNYFSELTASDPLNRILEMEWNTQLPDQVLAFVDFLSMAHSVEVRSPFLDYRLVEYVATIPGQIKISHGVVKKILKDSVKSLIPDDILKRPKEGFVMPIYFWMNSQLQGYIRDILSTKRINQHGYFIPSVVSGLLTEFESGHTDLSGKIWNLMMFQIWWEKYFG